MTTAKSTKDSTRRIYFMFNISIPIHNSVFRRQACSTSLLFCVYGIFISALLYPKGLSLDANCKDNTVLTYRLY